MDQKTVFYQLLEQHINSVSGKFQDKFCVTQESYDQIKEVLAWERRPSAETRQVDGHQWRKLE